MTATVTGSNAKTRSWTQTIVIDPPLAANAELTYRSNKKASLSVTEHGGQGTLVSAQWTCQDGTEVSGLSVDCPGKGSGPAQVTVADGAGNTATTEVQVVKAPKLDIAKFSRAEEGQGRKSAKVKVRVENTGGAVATGVKVCLVGQGQGVHANPDCTKLGDHQARQSKSANGEAEAEEEGEGQAEDQGDGHLEGRRQGIGIREDEGEEKALWLARIEKPSGPPWRPG